MAKLKEWWLKKDDEVEINGQRLKVLGVFEIAGCDPSHKYCDDEKTIYLENDLALCVSENDVRLFRVEHLDENTKRLLPLGPIKVKIKTRRKGKKK